MVLDYDQQPKQRCEALQHCPGKERPARQQRILEETRLNTQRRSRTQKNFKKCCILRHILFSIILSRCISNDHSDLLKFLSFERVAWQPVYKGPRVFGTASQCSTAAIAVVAS